VERARALVRSAARAEEWMREQDLGRVANLLRRATEIIEADPDRALFFAVHPHSWLRGPPPGSPTDFFFFL